MFAEGYVILCSQPKFLMGAFAPFFPMLKTITYFLFIFVELLCEA